MKKLTKYLVSSVVLVLVLNSCTAISGYLNPKEIYTVLDDISMKYEKLDSRPEGIGDWTMKPMCERHYFNIDPWVISKWLKNKYPIVIDPLKNASQNSSSPYASERIIVNDRLATRTYFIGSGVEYKVKWYASFSNPCFEISVTSHHQNALYSTVLSSKDKKEINQKITSLKDDKYISDSKIERVFEKRRAASKRSWNAVLGGVNNALSSTASDYNRINNNINNTASTRTTSKRWQDMSESEKKVEAEKYKYLKASEIKRTDSSMNKVEVENKVSKKKSENTNNKSTTKSRYGNCYHDCEGLSGKIHDKSTSAGACEKGCSLRHWLSNSEKAHTKCKEKFGVGELAQECHEGVKRY